MSTEEENGGGEEPLKVESDEALSQHIVMAGPSGLEMIGVFYFLFYHILPTGSTRFDS